MTDLGPRKSLADRIRDQIGAEGPSGLSPEQYESRITTYLDTIPASYLIELISNHLDEYLGARELSDD